MIFTHPSPPSTALCSRILTILLLFWVGVLLITPAPSIAQETGNSPDIVVMILSGAFPSDIISFNYTEVVDHSAARSDLDTLLKATGWKASEVRITEGGGDPEMTSVEFQVDGAVNWPAGVVLVEPFILTFKRFDVIQINYMLQGTMEFRSLRNYTNKHVDVVWTSNNSSYTYTIQVKDRDFEKLDLPLIVDPPKDPAAQKVGGEQPKGGRKTWAGLAFALAAGIVVYAIVSRLTRK